MPSAASAGIAASPSPVNADGVATTTITVTLKDALNRPTPGKTIRIAQGSGHSVIQGPVPPVTDANGQIAFTATDTVNETVTYTAVDETDGDLPVPGNAQVVFQNGPNNSCVATLTPPTGAGGNVVSAFATGFVAQDFNFAGISFVGCPGATLPAFLGDAVYVGDFATGDLFKLGAAGGAATNANKLANLGLTLTFPTVGKDGKLYVLFSAGPGGASDGKIVELNPATGAIVRTVVGNLTCAAGLAVDPLSGDLFYDDACNGFAANPGIFRVDPASPNPTASLYVNTPNSGAGNGALVFAPNGTLYVVSQYFGVAHPQVVRITGTDQPQPPAVTAVTGVTSDFWLAIAATDASGDATAFLVNDANKLELVDTTTNPVGKTTLADGNFQPTVIGPDGCLYSSSADTVYKLTDANGGCGFVPKSGSPSLRLDPPGVAPDPTQGTSLTFTASFANVAVPAGTPVFFEVTGANPELQMARTDAAGEAQFTYTGIDTGADVAFAHATVGGDELVSNKVRLAWVAGKHVTSLTINLTPDAGAAGQPFAATAALIDRSGGTPTPIAGATVDLTLGSQHCSAQTDANGIAACMLTPVGTGRTTFVATFDGTPQYREASASFGFDVLGTTALGPFMLYTAKTTKGGPKFFKLGPVTLADDVLGITGGYDVLGPLALGLPADVGGIGFTDPDTHLAAYAVKTSKSSAKFTRRTDLAVANECGGLVLTAAKPAALLVPASESAGGQPSPPDPAQSDVDHFLCYAAKVQKKHGDGTAATPFPKRVQLAVTDHFQSARRYDLKKVLWVCDPVAKSGSPALLAGPQKGAPYPITPSTVDQPTMRLVCYAAKPAKKTIAQLGCGPANATDKGTPLVQPKFAAARGLSVASQLETRQLDAKKELVLCLPSFTPAP